MCLHNLLFENIPSGGEVLRAGGLGSRTRTLGEAVRVWFRAHHLVTSGRGPSSLQVSVLSPKKLGQVIPSWQGRME